jgi:hypothetical protein
MRHVLLHLARLHREWRDSPHGVPWRTAGTRSDQASLSRTLRRLEALGLVLRQNQTSGNGTRPGFEGRAIDSAAERRAGSRSTHVRVLPEGLALAERLTKETTEMLTGVSARR